MLVPRYDEDGAAVFGDRQDRGEVARQLVVRDREMDALGRPQGGPEGRVVEPAELVGPDAGRVHDDLRTDFEGICGLFRRRRLWLRQPGAGAWLVDGRDADAGDVPALVVHEADRRRVVRRHGPVLEYRGPQDRERQPSVVGAGVVVEEAGDEAVGSQRGEVGGDLVRGDPAVASADAPASGEVVHPQRRRVPAGDGLVDYPALSEQRDEKRQRFDKMRRVLEQQAPLGEILPDETEFLLLEVPKAAVHQLGGLGRCARSEVAALDQRRPETPTGGVERDARPGDPAAHDDEVERLLGQPRQSDLPIEHGRRASHQGSGSTAFHKPVPRLGIPLQLDGALRRRFVEEPATIAAEHPNYRYAANLPVKTKASLAEDWKDD